MEISMKESENEERKKVDWFYFFPDDILLEILKRVPDAFLRYKVKYVCRLWFDIITNRILLDHASFILQNLQNEIPYRLVDIREEEDGIKVKEQYLDINSPGGIRHWCNEFLLISIPMSKVYLYVLNLTTNEGSYLPNSEILCAGHYGFNPISKEGSHLPRRTTSCATYGNTCGIALSFNRFEGIYKVVHVVMGPPVECEVLVLGRDIVSKWKKIQVPYMDIGEHIWDDTVSVQGWYMHWRIQGTNDLVSVDMVKEEVCRMSLPVASDRGRDVYSFFEMDGFLTFFDGVTNKAKAEIWVLKDFHKVKWEKLQSIIVDNSYFERYPRKLCMYRFCCMIRKRYYYGIYN